MIRSPVRGLIKPVAISAVNIDIRTNDAVERIANGTFVDPASEWTNDGVGGWTTEVNDYAVCTPTASLESLYQTLASPLSGGEAIQLSFEVLASGSVTLEITMRNNTTPVQTLFSGALSVGVHTANVYLSGAANRLYMTPTVFSGGGAQITNVSLIG